MNQTNENEKNVTDDISWQRFQKHLPQSKNLTLIILKGHLLVEQEMNDLIDDSLYDSKALFDAHMTFNHRLAVIKSIYGQFGKFPYKQITKLNVLRNQLVHNIEPKDFEKNIVVFVQELEDRQPKIKYSKIELENRLINSIAYLCGFICGYREIKKALVSKRLAKL